MFEGVEWACLNNWAENGGGRIESRRRQRDRDRLNSMPHKILEIDEILRVVVWYTKDTSEATTVSLACWCRTFEEPALSLLWVSRSLKEFAALLPSILMRTPAEEGCPTICILDTGPLRGLNATSNIPKLARPKMVRRAQSIAGG